MHVENAIFISAPDLDGQDQVVVKTAIKLLSHDGKSFELIDDNINNAHLLVIDADTDSGKRNLKQSRPGQVKLLLSSRPKSGKNIIAMQKPLEITLLKEILGKLFAKMQTQLSSKPKTAHTTNTPNKAGTPLLTDSLFHILLSTKENKEVIRVSSPNSAEIYVDGLNRSLATASDMNGIRSLIKTPYKQLNIKKLESSDFAVHSNQLNISSLYNTLWIAAIECSRGQILPGHSLEEPVRLRAWPNFTRNDFKPSHLKLAALLAQRATALSQLATQTNIAHREIIDFYNAAYAVDLVERNVTQTSAQVAQKKVSNSHRSLFSKIATRLGFGG